MTREEFIKALDVANIIVTNDEKLTIKFVNKFEANDLIFLLKTIFDYEIETKDEIILDLKALDIDTKIEAFRYALTREDLCDASMLLNIINLIKIYNTLDDSFFENEHIYFNSIEEMLDIKLELSDKILDYQTQLSIYFISLFKSYNKTNYEPLDKHIELPLAFRNIITSLDILTLSGIFSVSKPFSTSECFVIDDANTYLTNLLLKGSFSSFLTKRILEGMDGNQG